MAKRDVIRAIGITEVLIGLVTLIGTSFSVVFLYSTKPLGVLLTVSLSSLASVAIGIGIYFFREWARRVLVFFAGYIIFLKVLTSLGIIIFTGEILGVIDPVYKDLISLVYHLFIIVYFSKKGIRSRFHVG